MFQSFGVYTKPQKTAKGFEKQCDSFQIGGEGSALVTEEDLDGIIKVLIVKISIFI